VIHVRQRWTAAEVFTSDDIIVTGDRVFHVHSPDSGNTYQVDFGHDDGMPFCACEDWQRYHWPCKHFCACFQQTARGWDDLVCIYRDSPYFTIDTDVIQLLPAGTSMVQNVGADTGENADDVNGEGEDVAAAESLGSTESQAVQCREVLRQFVDATYLCSDSEQLAQLHTVLVSALAQFRQHLPADAGLQLNVPQRKRRRAPQSGRPRLQPIPVRRSRRRRVAASQVPPSLSAEVESEVYASPSHDDAIEAVYVHDETVGAESVTSSAADYAPHLPLPLQETESVTCNVGVSALSDTDTASADARPLQSQFTTMKLRPHTKKVL